MNATQELNAPYLRNDALTASSVRRYCARKYRAVLAHVHVAAAILVAQEANDAEAGCKVADAIAAKVESAVRKTLGKYLSDETLCGVVFDGMVGARNAEAQPAPAEPRAAESAGTCDWCGISDTGVCKNPDCPTRTAAAAVPAGGDAFDKFFYSALDPRPEPAMLDGKVLPLGTAVLYGACGGDADKFWLATLAMRKAFEAGQAAPAPRGGVTEAQVDAACAAYSETFRAMAPHDDIYRESLRAALEAALNTPAAQAQDAGPVAHVLVKNGEAIGIACDVAQDIPDGVYPFYKETRAAKEAK